MCYVCGHGDDEEDNKIVYCEVSYIQLSFSPYSLVQSVCMPNAMASREISKPATGFAAFAKLSKSISSSKCSVVYAGSVGEPCDLPTSDRSCSLSFCRV
jgi:hypothetical protein